MMQLAEVIRHGQSLALVTIQVCDYLGYGDPGPEAVTTLYHIYHHVIV